MTDLINRTIREDNAEEGVILWTVESFNRGWYTLRTVEGVEFKARAKTLEGEEFTLLEEGFDIEQDDYEDEEEAATGKTKMASQLKKYRSNYAVAIAGSGRKSLSNGDAVAKALEGRPLDDLYSIALRVLEMDLRPRYDRLNPGAQRMNIGNRFRNAFKNENHERHLEVNKFVFDALGWGDEA